MKNWTRTRTLVAGLALLIVTNAVVLTGAVYNRRGEPQALLRLSERELAIPSSWGFEKEDSGTSLSLLWRLPPVSRDERTRGFNYAYAFVGVPGEARWLDKGKLTELGFDLSRPFYTAEGQRYYDKQLPREVFLVLELDGPAYRVALQDSEEGLARAQTRLAANPGVLELKNQAEAARKLLLREQTVNSRLFVVDAGRDDAALRAKYPDRSHYAIVRGKVSVAVNPYGGTSTPAGHVSGVSVQKVNVPSAYREVFAAVPRGRVFNADEVGPKFTAAIAFGQRLEPWLVEARAGGG